jgi:hypothetical protein
VLSYKALVQRLEITLVDDVVCLENLLGIELDGGSELFKIITQKVLVSNLVQICYTRPVWTRS